MLIILYIAPICFGAIISPSSSSWQQYFLKTYNNKIGHNKHVYVVVGVVWVILIHHNVREHLESFEMWCWRREKISWTDHVRNEEVLLRVNEQRNILHEISKWKANWIGQTLRRNCHLQRVTEGKIKGGIEVIERRGRRRKKLLDDLKEMRGYCHLKEEAVDRTKWRARFGRGFGPVVRRTAEWMNERKE